MGRSDPGGQRAHRTDLTPGVVSAVRAVQAPSQEDLLMSDKSPRQSMSKKSVKSIKQKRAEARSTGSAETLPDKVHPAKKK